MTRFRLAIPVLAVLLVGIGIWLWLTRGQESTDDAQIEAHVVQIAARVGGTVDAVPVKDNQKVEAGAALVQIDPRDFEIAVQKAAAQLADAEASARAAQSNIAVTATGATSNVASALGGVSQSKAASEEAERGIEAARGQLEAAKSTVRQAEANSNKATRDVERLKGLLAKDEVSQQQFDTAVATAEAQRAAVDAAKGSVAAAEAGLRAAQSRLMQANVAEEQAQATLRSAQTAPQQISVIKARAAAAEAHAQQLRAELAQAQLNLQYATVKAPVKGMVSRKTAEPGQIVQPGQPLMALIPLEEIWVVANFKETQLQNMRPGQRATVKVDAIDGREFKGTVDSIAGATGARFSLLPPENATGNYVKIVQRVPVKILLDPGQDPERLLRPGLSATPTVYTR
ncbi:MAG TPA: HlyD family secretion protein [Vicinamibacterales bacterium]|nr:HlyD family secretion protein [Vicinamibacterales bacterium]